MKEHEKWLHIANEDLLAAKGLIKLELFSAAVYHSQQAAEKSMKGYLSFKKYPISKTHDLLQLLELCISFDKEFHSLFEAADYINPFATRFRYPTEFDIPDLTEATLALKHAATILRVVQRKTAEPETGQTTINDIT